MKILYINNFFSPEGGAEQSTYLTYKLFQAQGHPVFFYATDKKPYFEPEYQEQIHFPHFTDYDNLTALSDKMKALSQIFYNLQAEKSLAAYLSKIQPEIVHCGNLHYHLTPSVLKACRRFNLPVVMTLRDTRLICPAGTLRKGAKEYCHEAPCVTGSPLNCIRHRCYENSFSKSALVTAEFMSRKWHGLYGTIDSFISPSQALCDLALKAGFDSNKLSVIPNFASSEMLDQEAPSEPGQYFLYVGRLSAEKGVTDLIQAMERLPGDIPLKIAGVGPLEAQLKAMVAEKKLSNIEFLGFQAEDTLQALYQNAIATVVPSNWFENFSRSVMESLACGRPVIGSDVGGIGEMVEHGINGYLIQSGADQELAERIISLYQHPKRAIEMGINAKAKARSQYHPLHHYERLLALYEKKLRPAAIPYRS